MKNIDSRVDSNMNGLISDLQPLNQQPNVSRRSEGLFECANLVASMITKAGIETEILCINDAKDGKKPIPPLVYGESIRNRTLREKPLCFIITMMFSLKTLPSRLGRRSFQRVRLRVTLSSAEVLQMIRVN